MNETVFEDFQGTYAPYVMRRPRPRSKNEWTKVIEEHPSESHRFDSIARSSSFHVHLVVGGLSDLPKCT